MSFTSESMDPTSLSSLEVFRGDHRDSFYPSRLAAIEEIALVSDRRVDSSLTSSRKTFVKSEARSACRSVARHNAHTAKSSAAQITNQH